MARPRRVDNPPNPYALAHVEHDPGSAPFARLEVYEEDAKTILSENRSPDVGFRFSLNPYRGCFHGCIYCYARPTHQYLGFGAGTDFDRRIVVKVNAPELLDRRLRSPRWEGSSIAFSGNTDCYQPLEASYGLTRRCLEVCLAHQNPVGVITKGTVIRRDVDLLARLRDVAGCRVSVSLAFRDEATRRAFDPYAPPVEARLETIRQLAAAGLDVGLALSPILVGVNDDAVGELLERAAEAGAAHVFLSMVRLPREVRPYFEARLDEALSEAQAAKLRAGLRDAWGGDRADGRFGHRMRGRGPRWEAVRRLFEVRCRQLGLAHTEGAALDLGAPVEARPRAPRGQLQLPLLG